MSTKISIEIDGTPRRFTVDTRSSFAEVHDYDADGFPLLGWVSRYGNKTAGYQYLAVAFIDESTPNAMLAKWDTRKEAVAEIAAYRK